MATLAEFPDRQLLGEDVIWCGDPVGGFLGAIALFVDRAQAADSRFTLNDEGAAAAMKTLLARRVRPDAVFVYNDAAAMAAMRAALAAERLVTDEAQAMERAGVGAGDIDFIVFATLSPDYYFPGCGVLLQRAMKMKEIGALDVRNQCSGFVYALSVGDQFIRSGMYKNILVVGSEKHSFGLDFSTRGRNVSVIFGDGAGAVVVSAGAPHTAAPAGKHPMGEVVSSAVSV